jgi:hypothetical protein
MYCSQCGIKAVDEAAFCEKCGSQIISSNNQSKNQANSFMSTETRTKTLLLVAGILAIVFGVWILVVSLWALEYSISSFSSGFLFSATTITAGIMGVVKHQKTDNKSMTYVSWSALTAISIHAVWMFVWFSDFEELNFIIEAIYLIPNILLWRGAGMNKEEV